jgi:hypothetical protein
MFHQKPILVKTGVHGARIVLPSTRNGKESSSLILKMLLWQVLSSKGEKEDNYVLWPPIISHLRQ